MVNKEEKRRSQVQLQSSQSNVHGGKVHEVPELGMEFDTEQHAFDYYSEYAHRVGFSVRKQHVKKRRGVVTRRTLCCSKQGERGIDKRRENVYYHRPFLRVGCEAHMTFLLQKNAKFKVTSFNAVHNHGFAPSPAKHMLRSKRRLSFAQTSLATDAIKYDLLLQDRRYTELKSEFKMRQTTPVPVANVEMLRHAIEVYTPEMFAMFQNEYTKAWDYRIHRVSKNENITYYKVVYGDNGREHLVKFEAKTTSVQCSCMKVSFVGILCRHALKVLDKKNIKRIPSQYILKRWTKDAKDAIVSDYRGAQTQGSSQESIGKRYSYLSHDFQELVTLAAENEDMYAYAHQNLSKLLKDLEEMKKTYCSSTLAPNTNTQDDLTRDVPQLDDGVVSQCPRGIKRKATVGRPRKRFKDPLEQPRRRRSQAKATQGTSSREQGSQKTGHKIGQNEYQEDHADKEDEISTAVDSNVNDNHDVGDDRSDTFFPPTQVQHPLISRESQQLSNDNITTSVNDNFGSRIWPYRHMSFTELLQASSASKDNLQQHNQDDNNLDKQD
ncbi:hypothetical protein RJ640_017444 [Escallonia rubra]|uniref:Protein FAR1-RELATED SEQUENCE n=1 Tax=Escallonia rubra TaxID=112253 RepID=A0AA88UU20_9ASTE|nr:hypothetical protein RJ640_017444 [Escallonia rubra]